MKKSLILLSLFLISCDSHDSNYLPYTMKGVNVYVYDNKTDKEYFAGFVEGNYIARKETLSQCASFANISAFQNHLNDWSYVCCTVTPQSDCATKVR